MLEVVLADGSLCPGYDGRHMILGLGPFLGLTGFGASPWGTLPPCNGGIIGISQDPNIFLIIHCSHHYRVGSPPKACEL